MKLRVTFSCLSFLFFVLKFLESFSQINLLPSLHISTAPQNITAELFSNKNIQESEAEPHQKSIKNQYQTDSNQNSVMEQPQAESPPHSDTQEEENLYLNSNLERASENPYINGITETFAQEYGNATIITSAI